MTAEIIDVPVANAQAPADADVAIASSATSGERVQLDVWTIVTAERPADQPPTALVVVEGINRALSARISLADDGVSIADVETGVFGAGGTLREAIEDFRDALRDHLAVLTEEEALSPNLQHQLDVLRSYFYTP